MRQVGFFHHILKALSFANKTYLPTIENAFVFLLEKNRFNSRLRYRAATHTKRTNILLLSMEVIYIQEGTFS